VGGRPSATGRPGRVVSAAFAAAAVAGLVVGRSVGAARTRRRVPQLGALLDHSRRIDLTTGLVCDAAGHPRALVELDGTVRDRAGHQVGVYDDASATFRDHADRVVATVDEAGRIRPARRRGV